MRTDQRQRHEARSLGDITKKVPLGCRASNYFNISNGFYTCILELARRDGCCCNFNLKASRIIGALQRYGYKGRFDRLVGGMCLQKLFFPESTLTMLLEQGWSDTQTGYIPLLAPFACCNEPAVTWLADWMTPCHLEQALAHMQETPAHIRSLDPCTILAMVFAWLWLISIHQLWFAPTCRPWRSNGRIWVGMSALAQRQNVHSKPWTLATVYTLCVYACVWFGRFMWFSCVCVCVCVCFKMRAFQYVILILILLPLCLCPWRCVCVWKRISAWVYVSMCVCVRACCCPRIQMATSSSCPDV